MKRFKKLGIVLDLEKNNFLSIEHALDTARQNEAEIFVLCLSSVNVPKSKLKAFLDEKISLPYEFVLLTGKPVLEITQYASKQNIDLLILEPTVPHGLEKIFFGSLALSLVRKAHCPVWLIKKPLKKAYDRILITVDVNTHVENHDSHLNDKLVEIGTCFATRMNSECHLLTAWHLAGEKTLSGPFIHTGPDKIEELKISEKMKIAKGFEDLQQRHKDKLKDVQKHLIEGEPAIAISEFVKKHRIDMIIMGTIARTGIQGFVIGNTAETVMNQNDCSFMAIKPDDFVSPLLAEHK